MKPISGYDRLQALVRIPQFKADLDRISSSASNQKTKLLRLFIDKYNITYQVAQHLTSERPSLVRNDKCFLDSVFNGQPIQIIPSWESLEAENDYIRSNIFDLREGRYFAAVIDLSRKRQDLLHEFENLIDRFSRYVKADTQYFDETRGVRKDFQYSVWHVYDLCSMRKKPNFTEVARKLSGKTGQARDDNQLAACLKAVKRAYKRAIQIMKFVENEIKEKVDV